MLQKNIYLPPTAVTQEIEGRLPYNVIPASGANTEQMPPIVQSGKMVTITKPTGTVVLYTTNGNDPDLTNYGQTKPTTVYTAPFEVEEGTTVKAVTIRLSQSGVIETYSNVAVLKVGRTKVQTPVVKFQEGGLVAIFCDSKNAEIYYTTDGTMPTTESFKYTGPFSADPATFLNIIAARENWNDSDVVSVRVPSDVEGGLNALYSAVGSLRNEKAEKDGYYPGMRTGLADDIVNNGVSTSQMYTFRTTGGDESIASGRAVIKKAMPYTLAWNQMIKIPETDQSKTESGITIKDNRDGSYTITGTATADVTLDIHPYNDVDNMSGHKYLITGITGGSENTFLLGNAFSEETGNSAITDPEIFEAGDNNINVRLYVFDGATVNTTIRPQMYDLSKMYGYNQEPTYQDFVRCFPLGYYAPCRFRLLQIGTAVKTVGFNQWDEQWEQGKFDTKGNPSSSSASIRSKNFIKVFPNTIYNATHTKEEGTNALAVYYYDSEKKFISKTSVLTNTRLTNTFTTPAGARFIMFDETNKTYHGNICINLSWSGVRNGEYEPYIENILELIDPKKINADGTISEEPHGRRFFPDGMINAQNPYFGGDCYTETGAERYFEKIVLPASATVSIPEFHGTAVTVRFSNMLTVALESTINVNSLFGWHRSYKSYIRVGGISGAPNKDIYFYIHQDFAERVGITTSDGDALDIEKFNAWWGAKSEEERTVFYSKPTPTEIVFEEPLNMSYPVWDWGTEEILPANGSEPTTAPMSSETAYGMNIDGTIRNLPKNYISKESLSNLVDLLSEITGTEILMEWDATAGRYDFSIAEEEEQ